MHSGVLRDGFKDAAATAIPARGARDKQIVTACRNTFEGECAGGVCLGSRNREARLLRENETEPEPPFVGLEVAIDFAADSPGLGRADDEVGLDLLASSESEQRRRGITGIKLQARAEAAQGGGTSVLRGALAGGAPGGDNGILAGRQIIESIAAGGIERGERSRAVHRLVERPE